MNLFEIIRQLALEVFGWVLHDYQAEAVKYIVAPPCDEDKESERPRRLAVFVPTGYGKSSIIVATALLRRSVTISIVPSIPLGVDQCMKLKSTIDNKGIKNLYAYHVETEMSNGNNAHLIKSLRELSERDTKPSIVLFIGPESTLDFDNEMSWGNIVKWLDGEGLLSALFLDEAHCVEEQGLAFRESSLGNLGNITKELSAPIVAMSGSARAKSINVLTNTIGDFTKTIWMPPHKFYRGDKLRIRLVSRCSFKKTLSNQVRSFIQEEEKAVLQNSEDHQVENPNAMIVFCNTAKEATGYAETINELLFGISQQHKAIALTGKGVTREEKSFYMSNFGKRIERLEKRFSILCGTSVVDCGIDYENVTQGLIDGFPQNLSQLLQRFGRIVRGVGRDHTLREVTIVLTLKSFMFLYVRTFESSNVVGKIQRDDLMEVLRFFVLTTNVCWHWRLCQEFGCDTDHDDTPHSCNGNCPGCDEQTIKSLKHPMIKTKLVDTIELLFSEEAKMELKLFCTKLFKAHAHYTKTKPQKYEIEFLVMQLIASGIIDLQYTRREANLQCETKLTVKVKYVDGMRSTMDTTKWNLVELREVD